MMLAGAARAARVAWTLVIALALLAATSASLHAQLLPAGVSARLDLDPESPIRLRQPLLHAADRYIVIHLAENRLFVMERDRVAWSAPVGTGTGFRLEAAGRSWQFNTPRGVFRVQRKEKDPVWIKPDWAFIKEGQPVPPLDSPLRHQEGMLGTTAVYIGYELAIHGTDRPELVLQPDPAERRVSHGCIRMTNEDARALYYLVEVGTPVLIY
jgi:lipoprotein-anchoring transpeptidase ErfK/SrfK